MVILQLPPPDDDDDDVDDSHSVVKFPFERSPPASCVLVPLLEWDQGGSKHHNGLFDSHASVILFLAFNTQCLRLLVFKRT